MHNSFAEAIKEQTKSVLHQHVLLSLDSRATITPEQERQLDLGKYKDVCAQVGNLQRRHAHAHAHAHATHAISPYPARRTAHRAHAHTRMHAACTLQRVVAPTRHRPTRRLFVSSRLVSLPIPFLFSHSQLHEEYFDACLAHSFYALLRVLRSQHHRMAKVAVLVAPRLATTGWSDCI